MSGVFDLNGCIWERTAGLISNGNSNLATYGSSLLDETRITYSGTTVTAGTGNTTKYVTIYPYTTSDTYTENYNEFKKLATTRFGDGILETSTTGEGSTSWHGDYSCFPNSGAPFFTRGGGLWNDTPAGAFAFNVTAGNPHIRSGFRAVLVEPST